MSIREIRAKTYTAFKPTARDNSVAFTYEYEWQGHSQKHTVSDRWMRAKSRIASVCLTVGVHEFRVVAGVGARKRRFTVTCTDFEAMAFLDDWAARHFIGRGFRDQVVSQRQAQIDKGRFIPDGTLDDVQA